MRGDTIAVVLVVAAAAGYLIRRMVLAARAKRNKSSGCDHCGH